MKHTKKTKVVALALALCFVLPLTACGWLDDEPETPDSVSAAVSASTPDSTPDSAPDAVPDAVPDALSASPGDPATFEPSADESAASITKGEAEEGVLSGGEQLGSGFVEMTGEGRFDPDKKVAVSKSARPIRRIAKQDVYGNELPDYFYYYRNNLSENEKKIYDQIYANAVELDPYFELTTKVHYNRIDDIIISVRYDNPDLFWLDTAYSYTYDNSGYVTSVMISFNYAAQNIDAFKQQFYNCADSILEYVMKFDRDIDKVKYCHDLLTNINGYAWADLNQSAYSALCNGWTVCAGYSFAFLYLMQRLGIPSAVIYGYAGEAHLWNLVYVDGDYYEMDVTWDDPIGNAPYIYYYNYFNITSNQIAADHSRYAPSTSLPYAGGTYYSYGNYYGNYPGSDFSGISYGYPSISLPFIYPDAEPYSAPSQAAPQPAPQQQQDHGVENVFSGDGGETWSVEEVDYWLESLTDDEWYELWDILTDGISDEQYQYLDDMDWDEFVEFLTYLFNE